MATFTLKIYESITLNGNDLGSYTNYTTDNVNNIDNRTLVCTTGSWTTLFQFDSSLYPTDRGTFSTSSFRYGRITNISNVPVILNIQTLNPGPGLPVQYNTVLTVTPGSSFVMSSTVGENYGTSTPSPTTFTSSQYVSSIQVAPSSSAASIEYYIATT